MEYAQGNAAKAMVIDEIIDCSRNESITIFDFGCGDGGQWTGALHDHDNISYIGYEPVAEQAARAEQQLPNRVLIESGDQPPSVEADYVVSFSVLEHVVEREAYIDTLSRSLAPDGVAYLNYDDGHFRNTLDLNHPGRWPRQIKAWAHAHIGPLFAALGDSRRYQRRVQSANLHRHLSAAGLQVERSYFNNIADLKGIAGNVPPESRDDYTRRWVAFEKEINDMLGDTEGATTDGDDRLLWDAALSRTLVLTNSDPSD
jgi:2-polyprenyl-3-methyl-5-hydroxy-6-metoxy-1,4-benzoquinol methylase